MRAQVVATCVRGTTERTLKPAGEVDVVVVPDVRHDLAAQLAPVKVAAAWHPVKGQPHVPGFWTCNINTRQVTFNCWPPNTTYTTTSRPRPTLCVDGGSIASLFLSLFFFPLIYTLSLSFSQSQFLPLRLLRLLLISSSSSFVSSASLLFSPLIARLFLSFTFFFFFFITSPLIFPSVYPPTYESRPWSCHAYIYMSIHVLSSLSSPLSEEKFSSTPRFLKPPHFSSTPEKRGRSRVTLLLSVVQRFGARERGSRDGDGSIDVSSRDHARVFFFSFWDSKKGDVYLAYRRKKKRYEFFFFFPR